MNTLIADSAMADRFSQNARDHYIRYFTPQRQGEKYLSIYRDLLHS